MRQTFILITTCFIITACSKKTIPTTAVKKEETPAVTVLPPVVTPPVATTGRINMPLINKGKVVFETNCNKCHDLNKPADFTQQRWMGIIRWMAPKAKLTNEQKDQVLAYVQFYAKDAPKDQSGM